MHFLRKEKIIKASWHPSGSFLWSSPGLFTVWQQVFPTDSQALQASDVCGGPGRYFIQHNYTCFIENFFSFLKETRAENKRILLCDTQSHPMAHFPQPQWATCPHRHSSSLADRLTLGIRKLQFPATENCSKKYGTILQVIRFGAGMPDVQRRPKQTEEVCSFLPSNTGLTECRLHTAPGGIQRHRRMTQRIPTFHDMSRNINETWSEKIQKWVGWNNDKIFLIHSRTRSQVLNC